VPLQQLDFLLAASDQVGVAPTEAADVERTAALLPIERNRLRRDLLDGVHGQANAVDVELRRVAVGGGEGELVVVLELPEHLSHLDQEEAGRDRLDVGWFVQRQLAGGRDEDQWILPMSGAS